MLIKQSVVKFPSMESSSAVLPSSVDRDGRLCGRKRIGVLLRCIPGFCSK